jgi:hypothetical protein
MNTKPLTRDDIRKALLRLNELAIKEKILVEMSVYGGATMVLAMEGRAMTLDVDAVVRDGKDFINKAAKIVARENGWDEDWLNDGVKGFVSSVEKMQHFDLVPVSTQEVFGIRIQIPTPEYLLAMKCMAMRSSLDGAHDRADIRFLIKQCNLRATEDVLGLVEEFYPKKLVTPKVMYGIQEIMEELDVDEGTEPLP